MSDETPNIISITVKARGELAGLSADRDPSPHWYAGHDARRMELAPGATISAEQLLKLLHDTRAQFGRASTVELRLITESESEAPYWKAFGEWIQARREEEAHDSGPSPSA